MTLREYVKQFKDDDFIWVHFFTHGLPVSHLGSAFTILTDADDEILDLEVDTTTEKIQCTGTREIILKQRRPS